MNQPLVKMAQAASGDPTLLASTIHQYKEKSGYSWAEIAAELRIDSMKLAKLALCRIPRPSSFSKDAHRIATYVGMNTHLLQEFLQQGEITPANVTLGQRWQQLKSASNGIFGKRTWRLGFALIVILVVSAVAFAQPRHAEATLVLSQGKATISERGMATSTPSNKKLISAGDIVVVNTGDEISLAAGARAQLRLYDGSTVDLFENSTIQVSELYTNRDSYRVQLHMLAGKTVSRVIRLLGVGDTFRISTPSSAASVRGTIFTVEVIDEITSYFSCDKGLVFIEMGNQGAELPAGTELTAVVGQPLMVHPQGEEITAASQTAAAEIASEPTAAEPETVEDPEEETLPVEAEAPAVFILHVPTYVDDRPDPYGQDLPIKTASKTDPQSWTPTATTDWDGDNPKDRPDKTVPGKPPEGGALPPGQGGTPPGQGEGDTMQVPGKPPTGGGGNNGNNGGDNNGGGKKDK